MSLTPAVKVSVINQLQPDKVTCGSWKSTSFLCSGTRHFPHVDYSAINGTSSHRGPSSLSQNELSFSPSPALQSSAQDSFNSSFSFIQQSLNTSQKTYSTTATPPRGPEPPYQSTHAPSSPQSKPATLSIVHNVSKQSTPFQSLPSSSPGSQAKREELTLGSRFWQECQWGGRGATPDQLECDSPVLDIEIISSLSLDSDTASASSVTSGYESATPVSERGWDNLVKKYEGVLQDCLQNNHTHTKIESMMLKLQRLQQKAILDDDYDAAERFGKKLEELCRERGALKLGLPSRQPSVALFLERLRQVVHSALQRADCSQCRKDVEQDAGERSPDPGETADRGGDSRAAGRTVAQLRDMSRTLQDLVTSENRTQITVSPSASLLRLQEQEQALNLSIKEATAKVVMSQRLGSSLRRKVSETETQLLALHEAKLAAISGNDFSSAKEMKAEMKAVYLERERLDALAKRLHSLSSGSSQELARMKEQRQQFRQELEQREAQHESRLKENTTEYIRLLEDRLQSCGCPGLERIWEADLEACHLFLRVLQLRTPSCSGGDMEDLPTAEVYPPNQPSSKEEEDCAMLTALGGRWCPEANLQNSEFTKKLEEFLFCMEDIHPEDEGSEAADLTERCELISDRLMTLEDELQTAILNRDQAFTHILSLLSKHTYII
ncbi:hypothetical protein KUCAC02_024188 [Chaenocephalus aceratus]|uniref:Uncharacterized protein n=1 Tax=Chaenocephalus aceratus TaxID=36190 RepID=A0ACB9WI09_CHAAC|nr:hypothetical protein KUCAC02_024188 [Chaenocephalus aceratus]